MQPRNKIESVVSGGEKERKEEQEEQEEEEEERKGRGGRANDCCAGFCPAVAVSTVFLGHRHLQSPPASCKATYHGKNWLRIG